MKNNQKILLIIICIILVLITILAVGLSLNIKNKNNDINNSNNNESGIVINKEITRLKDDSEFFTIQNIINNFYALRINKDTDELLSVLNKEYIQNNNINKANVLDFINIKNDNINFQAEEIYYNAESSITYYFIKGYILDYPFADGTATYNAEICYLLIKDNSNNYSIMPLTNINNLEEYAKSYNLKEINIENNTNFKIMEISENNKLMSYISNFSNLMFMNSTKAYSMLDDSTKEKYNDFNYFKSQLENIYNKLSTKFLATGNLIKDNTKIYKIKNNDGNTITITEYYPNDFKIGFN